jgi:hypothetical protein
MQEQVPTTSAVCEAGLRHDRCRGQVVSHLAPAGQRCECPCHTQAGADPAGKAA